MGFLQFDSYHSNRGDHAGRGVGPPRRGAGRGSVWTFRGGAPLLDAPPDGPWIALR